MIDPTSLEPTGTSRSGATAGQLGMRLFLASLTMLFGAALVGFLVIRLRAGSWSGEVGLPPYLWWSTAILALLSLALVVATRKIRSGRRRALGRWLAITLLLGSLFMFSQLSSLGWMSEAGVLPRTSLQAFAITVLTSLHGLHVFGGLIATTVVLIRNTFGIYSAQSYGGVSHLALYWHYLGCVWLVLLAVLAA